MKSKAALEFLMLLQTKKEYYEEYKDTKIKTNEEYDLACDIIKTINDLILKYAKALAQ